jgi:hypothetical protein
MSVRMISSASPIHGIVSILTSFIDEAVVVLDRVAILGAKFVARMSLSEIPRQTSLRG